MNKMKQGGMKMAKKAYILQEHNRDGFAMDTKVYSSKARAIKAFTKEVNDRIAYDYFKDADDKEFFEAEKHLKDLNEWFNVHTTHHIIVTRPYDEKKWWSVLLKESAVALEFNDVPEGTSKCVHFQIKEECSGEYDSVESITLEEVELDDAGLHTNDGSTVGSFRFGWCDVGFQ